MKQKQLLADCFWIASVLGTEVSYYPFETKRSEALVYEDDTIFVALSLRTRELEVMRQKSQRIVIATDTDGYPVKMIEEAQFIESHVRSVVQKGA